MIGIASVCHAWGRIVKSLAFLHKGDWLLSVKNGDEKPFDICIAAVLPQKLQSTPQKNLGFWLKFAACPHFLQDIFAPA